MVAMVAVERWTELDWPGLASERETGDSLRESTWRWAKVGVWLADGPGTVKYSVCFAGVTEPATTRSSTYLVLD